MWSIPDIADALEAGLTLENEAIAREQAVYGLDAASELELHPLIARAFRRAGYGVFREQRYAAHRGRKKDSDGERCDFVLTPNDSELAQPDKAGTLFDPPDACSLDDAYWLEAKIAWQFTTEGPNARYGAQMLSISASDVRKLSKDAGILNAGLCLIAFVRDEVVAQHDLHAWYERAIARSLPVGYPITRMFEITDRLGNGMCAFAICPVNHL